MTEFVKNGAALTAKEIDKPHQAAIIEKPILEPPIYCEIYGKALASVESVMSHKREHIENSHVLNENGKAPDCLTLHKGDTIVVIKDEMDELDGIQENTINVNSDDFSPSEPTCYKCGEMFPDFPSLGNHLINHRELKAGCFMFSLECGICRKTFSTTGYASAHRKMHMGESLYICADCGKSFFHKSDFRRHRRIHSGEKPYACENCGKSYAWKKSLTYHIKNRTCQK